MNTLSIYRSSAGSGKTYTLVKEYLKLAIAFPQSFSHILAVTFTNKATEEMKTRIVQTLVEFPENKSEQLKDELIRELKFTPEKFESNATMLLGLILHNYSDFAVCTIDSFFNKKIIRSLAKEMSLPLKFDTELNQHVVIKEITNRLMLDAGKNSQLTQWLQDFIISKMNDDKGWNIERELHSVAKELFKEDFRTAYNPDQIITNDFVKELRAIKLDFEAVMKSLGKDFLKTINENNLTIADFSYGKSGVAGYLEKLSRRISPKEYEPGKRALETNENPDKWCSKNCIKKDEILSLAENKLRYILEYAIEHYNKHFESYITAVEVLNLIYIAGIISKLDDKLKEYRDENDILMISDTNILLKDFISGVDAPFIYEKTGNRYRYFMMDEFQDTSALQWNNMLPLIENALAGGTSSMMVGDAKQSIYRWRGGKMQLLLNGIQNDLKQYSSITSIEKLKTNYRSKKEIVEFNNIFFSDAPLHLPVPEVSESIKKVLSDAYHIDDVKQHVWQNNAEGGYVEIDFYDKKGNAKDEETETETSSDIALSFLLNTLKKLSEDGFEPKDICILVRNNSHGNLISKFLFDNGYKKIISSESLLISKAPQIVFLINVMKVLNDPDNKIARAEVLNYCFTYINISEKKEGDDIFSIVNDTGLFFKILPEPFSKYFSQLRKLPLYEMAEQVASIFYLNLQPDAYIQRFHDLVLEYLDKNTSSLSSFLDWWEENADRDKISVIVPATENAIQIMSIHKSKGLQFPVVIIPFPDWELKPKSEDYLWVHSDREPYSSYSLLPVRTTKTLEKSYFKEEFLLEVQQTLIDNLNLMYVAFTRAEERLYLFCPDVKTDKISRTTNLICKTIESNEQWATKTLTENGKRKFTVGIETGRTKKTITEKSESTGFKNPEIVSLRKYNSAPWQNKLVFAVNKNKISVDDEENLAIQSDYGILIHRLLSKIYFAVDAEKTFEEALSAHLISTEQKVELKKIMEDVLRICKSYKWFTNEWEIKTEAELLLPDGSVIRPDRVMIKNKNVVLLDYKTGEENLLHEKQLLIYEKNLLDSGYENVDKYLLYIKTMKLINVN